MEEKLLSEKAEETMFSDYPEIVFLNGGKLSKDSRWTDYSSKNF